MEGGGGKDLFHTSKNYSAPKIENVRDFYHINNTMNFLRTEPTNDRVPAIASNDTPKNEYTNQTAVFCILYLVPVPFIFHNCVVVPVSYQSQDKYTTFNIYKQYLNPAVI